MKGRFDLLITASYIDRRGARHCSRVVKAVVAVSVACTGYHSGNPTMRAKVIAADVGVAEKLATFVVQTRGARKNPGVPSAHPHGIELLVDLA